MAVSWREIEREREREREVFGEGRKEGSRVWGAKKGRGREGLGRGFWGAMTKAQLKTKYDHANNAATATLAVGVGDLKVKASCTDQTFDGELNLRGVSLGAEKPGSFLIDYDIQSQVGSIGSNPYPYPYGNSLHRSSMAD